MLFKSELITEIVLGNKTQTRRPAKDGEELHWTGIERTNKRIQYTTRKGVERVKIEVGKDYAVQPGRGQAGIVWHPEKKVTMTQDAYAEVLFRAGSLADGFMPLRIRILDIRSEDVRDISHADALAEGFHAAPKHEFLWTWCAFYDKPMFEKIQTAEVDPNSPDHCPLFLRDRPEEKYLAWVYKFEVVKK